MLFNVEEDPHETNNLADAHPEIVAEHLALLARHGPSPREGLRPAGRPCHTPNPKGSMSR